MGTIVDTSKRGAAGQSSIPSPASLTPTEQNKVAWHWAGVHVISL